jgi:hypothetical protein
MIRAFSTLLSNSIAMRSAYALLLVKAVGHQLIEEQRQAARLGKEELELLP